MALFDFITKTSYTFEGEKDDETVALFLHRHWFTIFNKVVLVVIASLFPFGILLVFGQYIISYKLIPLFTFMWASYVMVLWYMLFYTITMYTLDYWIVTNERIIDNIQSGFFSRQVSELSLATIQDVSTNVDGFLPTTMNYGSVKIQTAARESHFYFEQVADPQKVKDVIMGLIDQIEERKEGAVSYRNPRAPITNDHTITGVQNEVPQNDTPHDSTNNSVQSLEDPVSPVDNPLQ